ncbi:hypothetical protein T439DRAFT_354451 [Meredithblackwellia eburnea MCA 4105]
MEFGLCLKQSRLARHSFANLNLSRPGFLTIMPFPHSPINVLTPPSRGICDVQASSLALLHNTFILGANSIYEKASLVSEKNVPSFCGYIETWVRFIQAHFKGQESIMFPFLSKYFPAEVNNSSNQHHGFHIGLTQLGVYASSIRKGGGAQFDPLRIKSLMDTFGDSLVQHLHLEVELLLPERMGDVNPHELQTTMKSFTSFTKKQGWATIMPFFLTHIDKSTIPRRAGWIWPPVSATASFFVLNVLFFYHRSWWKFSPFDNSGEPQGYLIDAGHR